MKKNILFSITFLVGMFCHAQNSNLTSVFINKAISPSASVATLGSYGNKSGVDNKGKYNTSIDILNLKTGNLNYNLGISYSSGGLKLNDWGGRLGLLWSDNFTSAIYRTVRGLPDETSQKVGNLPMPDYGQFLTTLDQMSTALEGNYPYGIDGESDIFEYNIFGLTGSFMIVNGEVLQINYTEKLKIEYSNNFSSFTITLNNGDKYYYGVNDTIEYTTYDTVCSEEYAPAPKQKTAWFLTRMEDTNASSFINFMYSDAYDYYVEDKSQTITIKNKLYPGDDVADQNNPYEWNFTFNSNECTRTKISNTKYLTSVSSPDFSLNFSFSNRKDNPNEWLIKKIDLKSNNNILVNTVKFDYFKYGDNPAETLYGDPIRYFLKKLTIGKAEDQNYNFTYENPGALPARFTYGQDLNGVYNGYANISLLPAEYVSKMLHIFTVVNPNEFAIPAIQTGIRTSHFPESSYGMLSSIKYPTSGQEKIFYEPNTVIKDTATNIESEYYGVRTKKIELWSNDNEKTTKNYLYNKTHFDSISNKITFDSQVSSVTPEELDDYGGHLSATYTSGAIPVVGFHYKFYKINSNKLTSLGVFQGDPIAYTDITEKIDNRFNITKYVVFQDVFTQPIQGELNSYSQNSYYFWSANRILSKYDGELLNSNYKVKKISKWLYTFKDYKFIDNYVPARDYQPYNVPYGDKWQAYSIGRYVVPNRWYNNYKESETIILDNEEKLTQQTTNTYFDVSNFNNLKTSVKVSSDGSSDKIEYLYAKDLYTNSDFVLRYMVGVPMSVTQYKNNTPISKTKVSFGTSWLGHTKLLPLQQNTVPLNLINTSGELFQPEITYDQYDTKGNLIQYTTKEGIPVTILYGYNQTLPIIKIEGISYVGLMDVLGMDDNLLAYNNLDICQKSNNDIDTGSEDLLIASLDNIRQNPNLLRTQITTYTYDPLVGLTSKTPSSGMREKYVYDASNRLIQVKLLEKDALGVYVYKASKEYKYNYKN
ncbi:hypothetical protein [Chryseobacterium sp. 22543]|uniref:hypothetical protein n=1 Tax=Chryseobacterium sp. 22543 TaxID=3453940 RepID=UPI003F874095